MKGKDYKYYLCFLKKYCYVTGRPTEGWVEKVAAMPERQAIAIYKKYLCNVTGELVIPKLTEINKILVDNPGLSQYINKQIYG